MGGKRYSVPLPLWERPDRIVRCDPGEGFVATGEYPSSYVCRMRR